MKTETSRVSIYRHLRRGIRLMLAALREIFDEAAYSRFLTREHANSTPEAYAAFLREREAEPSRPQRCC